MKEFNKYVGLDVPKETIAVAAAESIGEVRYFGEIANTPKTVVTIATSSRPATIPTGSRTAPRGPRKG